MELEERIKEVFKKTIDLKNEEVSPDAHLEDDLGMDSTELVELTIALEKTFGIKIGDAELNKFLTVQDVINLIKGKTGS